MSDNQVNLSKRGGRREAPTSDRAVEIPASPYFFLHPLAKKPGYVADYSAIMRLLHSVPFQRNLFIYRKENKRIICRKH